MSAEKRDVWIAAELSDQGRDLVGAEVVICPFFAVGLVVEFGFGDRQLEERPEYDRALGGGQRFHAFERIGREEPT